MPTHVVMYDYRLYAPGHLVHRWATGMTKEVKRATKFSAPFNKRPHKSRSAIAKDGPPGYLKSSVRGTTRRAGLRKIGSVISSDASYAAAVALGTGTISSPDMFLPFNPGHTHPSDPRRVSRDRLGEFKDVVSGQRAQNFFEAGLDIASRRYSSLRG